MTDRAVARAYQSAAVHGAQLRLVVTGVLVPCDSKRLH
jgi:hypothetical protein